MKKFMLPRNFQISFSAAGDGVVMLGTHKLEFSNVVTFTFDGCTPIVAARSNNAVKVEDGRVFIGADGEWVDSVYLRRQPNRADFATAKEEGATLTSLEIVDLTGAPKERTHSVVDTSNMPVRLEGEFDFCQRFRLPVGIKTLDSLKGGLQKTEGNTLTTVPACLSGDFCLVFEFSGYGEFSVFEQGDLKVIFGSEVEVTIGDKILTVPSEDSFSKRIVLDRYEGELRLISGGVEVSTDTEHVVPASTPTLFEGYEGLVDNVAYASRSILKGRKCSDSRMRNYWAAEVSLVVDRESEAWSRRDSAWRLESPQDHTINLAFEVGGDSPIASIIESRQGRIYVSGEDVGAAGVCFLSLYNTGSVCEIYRDKEYITSVPYVGEIVGVEGTFEIFSGTVRKGKSFSWQSLEYKDVRLAITGSSFSGHSVTQTISYVDELLRIKTFTVKGGNYEVPYPWVKLAEIPVGKIRLFLDQFEGNCISPDLGGDIPKYLTFKAHEFKVTHNEVLPAYQGTTLYIPPVFDDSEFEKTVTLKDQGFRQRSDGRIDNLLFSLSKSVDSNKEDILNKGLLCGVAGDFGGLVRSGKSVSIYVLLDDRLKGQSLDLNDIQNVLPISMFGSTELLETHADLTHQTLRAGLPSSAGSAINSGSTKAVTVYDGGVLSVVATEPSYKNINNGFGVRGTVEYKGGTYTVGSIQDGVRYRTSNSETGSWTIGEVRYATNFVARVARVVASTKRGWVLPDIAQGQGTYTFTRSGTAGQNPITTRYLVRWLSATTGDSEGRMTEIHRTVQSSYRSFPNPPSNPPATPSYIPGFWVGKLSRSVARKTPSQIFKDLVESGKRLPLRIQTR